MSLRWSSYVAPKLHKGGSKTKNGRFPSKIALRLNRVCLVQSFFVWNCQRRSCKTFISLTIRTKIVRRATPSTWNFGPNWPRWNEDVDFRSNFARWVSAVTPSEKVQLTLIGSPLRAFQWDQDEHRTLSLSPPKGTQNAKCPKFEL